MMMRYVIILHYGEVMRAMPLIIFTLDAAIITRCYATYA